MTIMTSLEPAATTSMPGTAVPLALRIHNTEFTAQMVTVHPTGALADYTVVEPASFELAPDESVDVSYVVTLPLSLAPGLHTSTMSVSVGEAEVATTEATIEVMAVAAHVALIGPPRSKSASNGRHRCADIPKVGCSMKRYGMPIFCSTPVAETGLGCPFS